MGFLSVKWADMDRTAALKGCNCAAKNAADAIDEKNEDIEEAKQKFAKGGMQRDRFDRAIAELSEDIEKITADKAALEKAAEILRG